MRRMGGLGVLGKWGRFVHRHRWHVLALGLGLIGLVTLGLIVGSRPGATVSPQDTESATARALANQEFSTIDRPTILLIYRHARLTVQDLEFRHRLEESVEPLRTDMRVRSVITPYDSSSTAFGLTSKDGHEALVVVQLAELNATFETYDQVRDSLASSDPLEILPTGSLAIQAATADQGLRDVAAGTSISLPLTGVVLLVVFGTVIAATMPLGVGTLAVVFGTSALFVLARLIDVTSGATELLALIGLGVGIDYSLFIVSRFREELARGLSSEESLAVAMSTAGRTVLFSGLAVVMALSSMLFLWGSAVGSMGLSGSLGVLAGVLCALTVLPALLAVLGGRINWLRLPVLGRPTSGGLWRTLTHQVMRWPGVALITALAIVVLLALPVRNLQLGPYGIAELPPDTAARQNVERLVRDFPNAGLETIPVVLDYSDGDRLTASRAEYTQRLVRSIGGLPGVLAVDDPTAPDVRLRQVAVGHHVVELQVHTSLTPDSAQAKSLVAGIRKLAGPPGGRLLVGGQSATDIDAVAWIEARVPVAAAYVIITTYVVIFLLVGSVLLPLKAVLTNLLSVAASFGVVVWVFQEGHLSGLLDFTPQSLDPTIVVLIFSILCGLSMDYEVLMLSRIQEAWRAGRDTQHAVADGLERNGQLITGAAAVMVVVFASFGLVARELPLQQLGVGLAVAVALDATVVRILIVPAAVRMLGDLSWWAPSWLIRFPGPLPTQVRKRT